MKKVKFYSSTVFHNNCLTGEEKAVFYALIVSWLSVLMLFAHCAVVWHVVCDCDISCSYSLTFFN